MSDADRELLELAAKAHGGIPARCVGAPPGLYCCDEPGKPSTHFQWNPITDDGDALRLAVKLKMTLGVGVARGDAGESGAFDEPCDYAATRLAITRAAAEIGRQMRGQHE